MPVTRNQNDFNHTTEWTSTINEIPNQSSFIKSMNLFDSSFTNQEAILFDKIESTTTLMADVNRRGGPQKYGKDDKVETFSLPLGYMAKMDYITKQDYMSKRRAGTADEQDTFANVLSSKLTNLRRDVDQTHEYLFLQAIKGVTSTPSGATLADMFTLFNVAQPTVDFLLGTSTTNVMAKIAEVKDTVVKNLKTGGVISGPLDIIVNRSFFDKLVNHATVKAAWYNSSSNTRYQSDLSNYMTWGISDVFEYQGCRFMVYSHEFNLPDGTTEAPVATDTGHVIPRVSGNSIFKAIYGPSQRIDVENGAEMHAFEYRDPKQKYHEVEVETAPLMYATKPAALVKLTTSN